MGDLWRSIVIDPMMTALDFIAAHTGSYAIAIVLFTIAVKLVLLPLTIKQLQNARKQQVLAPLMAEVRAKHGSDRVKLNAEMMALYKEHDANPIAGCLPMFIQLPILIGLYNALYTDLNDSAHLVQVGASTGFLWVHNLALPDFWSVTPPGATVAVFNGLFILPLLAGGFQWIQQRMMMNNTPNMDPQQKMMNQMMQFMPLMVIFFGFRFPAGLAIYWVTSTLVGIVQQYFINGWGSLADMIPALRRYQPAYVTAGRVIRGPSAGPSTPTQKLSLRAGTSEGDSGTSDRAADQQRGASKAPRVQQSNRRPVVNATRPTGPRKQGSRR